LSNVTTAPTILPGILVPPSWIADRIDDPSLRLVDLREADAFAQGHIPGAVHLDLPRLGTKDGTRDNVLLPPGPFAELMEELGISTKDIVVAYDDQWGLAAARLVWALHYYGHHAAGLLDGGWDRWTDEGRPVAEGGPQQGRGTFRATPHVDLGVEIDWLRARLGGPDPVVVDTRTPAEYEKGHVPGALSWDWFNAVPAGSWDATRDPEELRAEWSAMGIEVHKEIVVYCRSGMRAAHTWVALKHAGFPRVRLYDGSWQEWSASMVENGGE
jgi:thiosulfate/3-mercaptopyruvate sulfurtransferase